MDVKYQGIERIRHN